MTTTKELIAELLSYGEIPDMDRRCQNHILAAARRLAVLEEEVEAARNILTDAALLTPAYNAERRALAAGSAMPGDYSAMDGYTEARAATDKARENG